MDDLVQAALTKWPDVPHCYGWLGLDARGVWRMRDAQAQEHNAAGDKIRNAALLGFINRNYLHDQQGRWYFQNGPQRVYVNLEATPYIVRTSPDLGLLLHTGVAMGEVTAAYLTQAGQLILRAADTLAQMDDRDLAGCLASASIDGKVASDEALMTWLADTPATSPGEATESTEATGATMSITLATTRQYEINVQRGELAELMQECGYEARPQPDQDAAK